jgi:hypothetical protein
MSRRFPAIGRCADLPPRSAQIRLDRGATGAHSGAHLMDDLAIATFVLAGATVLLAVGVGWQIKLQRDQLAASQRPCVYPITPHTWLEDEHLGERGRFLSFLNGGTGIAQKFRYRLMLVAPRALTEPRSGSSGIVGGSGAVPWSCSGIVPGSAGGCSGASRQKVNRAHWRADCAHDEERLTLEPNAVCLLIPRSQVRSLHEPAATSPPGSASPSTRRTMSSTSPARSTCAARTARTSSCPP